MSEPLDDLRAALGSVEPSASFEARTLARIDGERTAAPWRAWMFLAPVAAAALLIVSVSLRPAPEADSVGRVQDQPPSRVGQAFPDQPAPIDHPQRKTPHRAIRAKAKPVLSIPENAHADQAIALRRLMMSAKSGQVLGAPDASHPNEDGTIRLPAIELKPIVIAPVATGQGGGSER